MNIAKELTRDAQPGALVKWKAISGEERMGALIEWDNGTAIVRLPDGKLKAVRCD